MNSDKQNSEGIGYIIVKRTVIITSGIIFTVLGIELLILTQATSVFTEPPPTVNVPETTVSDLSSLSSDPNSKVGQPLSQQDQQTIRALIPNAPFPSSFPRFEQMPQFILHDTAGEMDNVTLTAKQKTYIGPKGLGIAAYVPREGNPIITRPRFFDPNRPTAAAYEKALDILSEKARDTQARQIWQLASPNAQNSALNEAVSGLNQHQSLLVERAKIWLNSPSEAAFNRQKGLDGAKTTALWGIKHLCRQILLGEVTETLEDYVKSPENTPKILQSCRQINPMLETSSQRVESSVNVELLQKRGSDCWVTDAQVQYYNDQVPESSKISANQVVPLETISRSAYTDTQYQGLAYVYLIAALQAGRFPEVTTHFWLDYKIGDHCDPRGFDLNRFYETISNLMGHPWDTVYGIKPQYGVNPAQGDNVWWSEQVLGFRPLSD